VNAAFGGNAAKAISGKAVRVTGRVVLYRGKPEIVIATPDQLTIDPVQPAGQ
jgi:DNA/RNA endonuclease YhcR with UshA esterase domain